MSSAHVVLLVPPDARSHFGTLDDAMDDALRLADSEELLTPPAQPELRELRGWLCDEVAAQGGGAAALGLARRAVRRASAVARSRVPAWDRSTVSASSRALVAADDAGRVFAASTQAATLLDYALDQLRGLRLVALIPPRFQQAHVAGFTLHLLNGGGALLGCRSRCRSCAAKGLRRRCR
jgi:PAS domain-containing protein